MDNHQITVAEFTDNYLEQHPEGRVFASDICDLFRAKNDLDESHARVIQNQFSTHLQTQGYVKRVISVRGVKRQGFIGLRLKGLDRAVTDHPQTDDIDTFLSEHTDYGEGYSVPVFQFMSEYVKSRKCTEGQLTIHRELSRRLRLRGVKKGKAKHFNNVWECFIGVRLK